MRALLPDDSPRTLLVASGLGAASSSCSYASVALARSLFRTGADFTAAMAFEIASTNLVAELGIVMALLLGWQFLVGEFVGGPLMIVLVALLFRAFLRPRLVEAARAEAERGRLGSMEGHAQMDMSVGALRRLFTPAGFTATADSFVMDWAAVLRDVVGGLVIAGALAAWVPDSFWRGLFLAHDGTWAKVWGPVIGPLVAMLSFVCSVGNVPLAAVLWNGGISFGGVVAFIFADLLILPILNIYRKYYGGRMSLYLLAVSYVAMAIAGLVVGVVFQSLGWAPAHSHVAVFETRPSWNYTSFLNIAFLVLAAGLGWRFLRTGGPEMLRAMSAPAATMARDPVCGMSVDPATAEHVSTVAGRRYYFCSAGCKASFDADPARYLGDGGDAPAGHEHGSGHAAHHVEHEAHG
jgi:uncharacterized membrane protein YraQ (UPF0718 family)/YHS domain-containing protein